LRRRLAGKTAVEAVRENHGPRDGMPFAEQGAIEIHEGLREMATVGSRGHRGKSTARGCPALVSAEPAEAVLVQEEYVDAAVDSDVAGCLQEGGGLGEKARHAGGAAGIEKNPERSFLREAGAAEPKRAGAGKPTGLRRREDRSEPGNGAL